MSSKRFAACHWSRDHTQSTTDAETHLRVTRETPPPPRSWAIFTPTWASHCSRGCVRLGRFPCARGGGQSGGAQFLESHRIKRYWRILAVGSRAAPTREQRRASKQRGPPCPFSPSCFWLATLWSLRQEQGRGQMGEPRKQGVPDPHVRALPQLAVNGEAILGGGILAAQPSIRIQPHTSSRATVTKKKKKNPKQPQQPVSARIRPKRQRGSFSLTQGRFDLLLPGAWLHEPLLL